MCLYVLCNIIDADLAERVAKARTRKRYRNWSRIWVCVRKFRAFLRVALKTTRSRRRRLALGLIGLKEGCCASASATGVSELERDDLYRYVCCALLLTVMCLCCVRTNKNFEVNKLKIQRQ